jgi:16S rRNA G966 N2-methylase RsmD
VLRANLAKLGITAVFRTHPDSVGTFLRRLQTDRKTGRALPFDLVFLDPPYDAAREYEATLNLLGTAPLLAAGALVIAEHRRKVHLEERYGNLERTRLLEQGDAALSFYAAKQTAAAE